VKHVARDQHEIGGELDRAIHGARERLRHVRLALIDAARSQPLILAVAEVQVGEMDEAQTREGRGRRRGRSALSGCARGG
jgi:hypothetical protein